MGPRKYLNSPTKDNKMLIFRMDLSAPPAEAPLRAGTFVIVSGAPGILANFLTWVENWGLTETLKVSLKILTGKRIFFGVLLGKKIVQSGWANLGFCRHYAVERDAVVLGPLWTAPDHRGQGLASAAMRQSMTFLYQRGRRRFYVDTTSGNRASQRMIEKAGFAERPTHVAF